MKVVIAGGGVSGAYLAWLLSKEGFKVDVFDPQKKYRKACGDSTPLTSLSGKLAEKLNVSLNYIDEFEVFVNGVKVKHLTFNKPLWIIMDKWKFVERLRELSKVEGASYHYIPFSSKRALNYELIIDARGPYSNKDYIIAYRFLVKGSWHANLARIDFRPQKGGLYWIFPHGNGLLNVGSGFLNYNANTLADLKNYLKNSLKSRDFKIVDIRGAPIAIIRNVNLFKNEMIKVGEAAGLINSTSGEGIRQALLSSDCLVKSLSYCNEDKKCIYRNYKRCLRGLLTEIEISRKMLKVATADVNDLSKLFKNLPDHFWEKYLAGKLSLGSLIKSVLRPSVIASLGVKGLLNLL